MPFINCPKCGQKGVRKESKRCPACGFDIAQYLIERKHKQSEQEIRAAHKAQKDYQIQERVRKEQKDIATAPQRQQSYILELEQLIRSCSIKTAVFAVTSPISFLFGYYMGVCNIAILSFFFCFLSIILFCIFLYYLGKRQNRAKDLCIVKNSLKEYEQILADRKESQDRLERHNLNQYELNHPQCPHCNSTNTHRIATARKATSFAFWGLASRKIWYDFECKQCGHKW